MTTEPALDFPPVTRLRQIRRRACLFFTMNSFFTMLRFGFLCPLAWIAPLLLPGLVYAAPDTLTQAVTYQGQTATMRLTRLDLRGQYFELLAQNATGTYDTITAVAERSYLGTVDEFSGAVSAGILKDDGTFWGAVIFDRGGTWHTLGSAVTSTRYAGARPNYVFPSLELTPGQAGTTTYGFDIAADVNSDSFTATGSSITKSFEGVEYTISVLRALYMSNALLRPHLARVIIRTSAAVDTLKAMDEFTTLPLVKAEWLANQTTATRDYVALAGRAMGGLSYGPGMGNTWGYTVQPSENDGNFWVYLRHELAHNMSVGHGDGGGPEGETINGRYNNGYARMGTSELELVLNNRDSLIAQFDNEGTFTTINLPPYACLDSAVIQRLGATQATINVLANDHDANGHAITGIVSFDVISNNGGVVTKTGVGASASLVYMPPSDFVGFDWFYYTISDSTGQTATGLVTIDVNPPDTSFVGWWRLDEASYSDYMDSSPMGTNATQQNITMGAAGRFGKAATFNGTSGYVTLDRVSLGGTSATITAWIKRPSAASQASMAGRVFDRTSTGAAGLHFGTANELRYTWNNSFYNWNSGLIPPADQWVLVALVVEPTKATIYMHDGTTLSSAVNSGTHNPDMGSGIINLGRDTYSSTRRYKGDMDDVRLFRRALTQAEILALVNGGAAETPSPFDTATGVTRTALTWQADPQATAHQVYAGFNAAALVAATTNSPEYQGATGASGWSLQGLPNTTYFWRVDTITPNGTVKGKTWSFSTASQISTLAPDNGLIARWKLDETSGTTAASTTGTYPGTVSGSPVRTTGVDGNAISFDGINDMITTGSSLLSNRTMFSMSGWYRSSLTTGNRVALWGQNDVVEFGISGSTLMVYTASGGNLSIALPTPNQWHHLACVGDGLLLKIYVDGVLAASGGSYVATSYGSSTSYGFNIGAATWDPTGNWFTGQIDDVRVYNRVLSDVEVYNLSSASIPNAAPVFTIDPMTLANGTAGSLYSATISGSATDTIGDILTYTKISGPVWLAVAADGTLSGTPAVGDVGDNTFTVRVTDGGGLFDQAVITLTIVPAVTSITFDSPAADTVRIPALVGLVLESTIGSNGTGHAPVLTWSKVSGPGTVTFADTSAADTTAGFSASGTYVLRLDAYDGYNHFTRDLTVVAGATAQSWSPSYGAIGTVTSAANSSSGSTYTLTGRSAGIDSAGTSDSFQLYGQSFSGDFDLICQVSGTDLSNTTNERIGLISRGDASSAGAISTYVGFNTTGTTYTASWITRATANAANTLTNVTTTFTGNRWVRLSRVGDQLTGYYGSNGSAWTQAGSVTFTGTIRAGLCWSGDRTGTTGTGTFTNVAIINPNIGAAANAGPDQVITLPSSASLVGTAADDGLPIPAAVTFLWQKISGPGSVTFTNPASANTPVGFSTSGSYQLRLVANDGQVKTFDDLAVQVNPVEPINPDGNGNGILDAWESTMFGNANPGNNPPGDDPDGDGISNLMEYALNTDPLHANTMPLEHDVETIGTARYLRLTLPKNPAATNLEYAVEVSQDLVTPSWNTVQTTIESDTATGLRVRDYVSISSSSRRFIRLKVTVIP